MRFLRFAAASLTPLLLLACASVPPDNGRSAVTTLVAERGIAAPAPLPAAERRQWLAQALSREQAIRLALLQNPQLRAQYAQLGYAAADVYEAGRLHNPVLSLSSLSAGGAPYSQLSAGIAFDFTQLLFLRQHQQMADARLAAAQSALAAQILQHAAEVETAYWRVAAAQRSLELRRTLAAAAATSAALAQRYYDAGNLPLRSLASERAAAAQAELQVDAAELERVQARAALREQLGLAAGDDDWQLAETLAPPADDTAPLAQLQALALSSRLDLRAAREHVEALRRQLRIARPEAAVGAVEAGAGVERDFDGTHHSGPGLAWRIPLFDWGRGRRLRAQADLDSAEAELQARELAIGNEVAAARATLQLADQRCARYARDLLPARQTAFEQTQRSVNSMLGDVFELLTVRQQSFDADVGYIDALRDAAIARAQLSRAVGRRLATGATPAADAAADADATPPHEHEHQHGDAP